MEAKLMLEIAKKIEAGESVALVTLIEVDGSSPGKKGNIMAVFQDETIMGTVGGGNLEYTLIKEALNCIGENESRDLEFELVEDAALHMKCGGKVKAFIKIFQKKERLLIVGGGHIGGELYTLGHYLGFETILLDDREEFCNKEKYPFASELIVGDIEESLKNFKINEYTYIVIVSRGHKSDKEALRVVINEDAKYIGMIGSRKKITETYKELIDEGVETDKLKQIFSPVGLDISNGTPKEIAFSVMAEILKVKNSLTGKHMREVKEIKGVW